MTTRRQFLTMVLLAAPVATVSALSTVAALETKESCADSDDYIHIPKSLIEYAPEAPPAYGPLSRTQAINQCAAKIDETIIVLERFHTFLLEARALSPDQVDGSKWIKLEYAVIDAELELDNAMQSSSFFEDALEAATGKRSYYWCLKADLVGNEAIDAAFVQSEINAFREDYPGQVAELQALLDARTGVQL